MSSDRTMKLVVIIPALNEEKTIGHVIDEIPRRMGPVTEVGVVVVDDGSEDNTAEIARQRGTILVRHEHRMGLGTSFADGLARALEEAADVIVSIDGDGQFNPGDIPELVRPILEDRADFVTATRFARKELVPKMPWIKKWGNRQMCRLVNLATGTTKLTDASCGFRAFNLKAALNLHLGGRFTHVQETIIDLASKGMRIAEVPVPVRGERQHGRSRIAGNIPAYAVKAGGRVLRTVCRTRPMAFFGLLAGIVFGLGVLQGLVVFVNWLLTGRTHPVQSLLIGASLFITVGVLILILALIADMLDRVINVSERLLYYAKLDHYRKARARRDSKEP